MQARWYVVNVYSGSEKKVAESIKEQIVLKKMEDRIQEVWVPSENVVIPRKGDKPKVKEQKFFPGYILVKMDIDDPQTRDETLLVIKNTARVSGFLGSRIKPMPISDAEVQRIMDQIEEGTGHTPSEVMFEIGEQVRVTEGAFMSFIGTVRDVDPEKNRLTVLFSIFGRETPMELDYNQVEKV